MSVKTGIYGGSFNPIHRGHILLAKIMLEQLELDEIWFVVSPQNPFKRSETLLEDGKRLELVRLALENEKGLKACDYEFHLPKPSYMWNTLQNMSKDFPDRAFTLLVGADNWQRFREWYHYEDILENYQIAVYPRRGCALSDETFPQNVKMIKTQLINISSTQIRGNILRGEPFEQLVPSKVAMAIRTEGLYLKR